MPTTNAHSLFGHFANASGSPEKHATEALTYILRSSRTAQAAIQQFMQQVGVEMPQAIFYESQVICSDGCIPDVVGFDSDGLRHVIIEGKFWAPLTSHQPVSYLKSLAEDSPGIVLFVAPSIRLANLWRELQVACTAEGTQLAPPQISSVEEEHTQVDPKATGGNLDDHQITHARVGQHTLAVTSWRHLLSTLQHALQAAGEDACASDVGQLQGLCEAMDAEAFLPLTLEELDPAHGRRLKQFGNLIDGVLDSVEHEPWFSSRGRYEADSSSFGCNFRMHDYECWLGVSGLLWDAMRTTPNDATPLWLEFYGTLEQIRTLQMNLPRLLEQAQAERFQSFSTAEGGPSLAVALYLPLGVEEGCVISHVIRQLKQIAAAVAYTESHATIPSPSKSPLPV